MQYKDKVKVLDQCDLDASQRSMMLFFAAHEGELWNDADIAEFLGYGDGRSHILRLRKPLEKLGLINLVRESRKAPYQISVNWDQVKNLRRPTPGRFFTENQQDLM